MNLTKVFKQIEKWEGTSFENVDSDLGGITSRGVTFPVYLENCKNVLNKKPTLKHFKILSQEEAFKFYNFIWIKCGLENVENIKVATCLYDFIFNSQYARREIQKFLITKGYKLDIDNIFGKQSFTAINDYVFNNKEKDVLKSFFKVREDYLGNLVKNNPSQQKFLLGWMNRINDLKLFLNDFIQ
jgi:lysozyme family protein